MESGFSFDQEAIAKALVRIYETDFNPVTDIEQHLFTETLKTFNKAVDTGVELSHFNPENEFINQLKTNNAVFAAFRTHRMQNDIAAKLLDEKGNLKPFSQFYKDVQPITDHHVKDWLRTEYDTAVIRAHQAADWKQYEAEKDVLPNLEWLPSTSIVPGEDHRIFWGSIHPVGSSFWNEHKPGDRWNCKCRLQATEKPSNSPKIIGKNAPENRPANGLDNNPAKDGMIFSKSHPFYTKTYPGADKAVREFIKRQIPDENFNIYKSFKNGGKLIIHNSISKKSPDYKRLLSVGIEFAKTGKEAKMMPKLYYDKRGKNNSDAYKRVYHSLIGTQYEGKCPDLLIDGIFYEFEGFIPPFKKDKISRMITHGAKQSPRIIIDNTKGASDRYIRRNLKARSIDKSSKNNIEEVWIYEKGKVRFFYKKQKGE